MNKQALRNAIGIMAILFIAKLAAAATLQEEFQARLLKREQDNRETQVRKAKTILKGMGMTPESHEIQTTQFGGTLFISTKEGKICSFQLQESSDELSVPTPYCL